MQPYVRVAICVAIVCNAVFVVAALDDTDAQRNTLSSTYEFIQLTRDMQEAIDKTEKASKLFEESNKNLYSLLILPQNEFIDQYKHCMDTLLFAVLISALCTLAYYSALALRELCSKRLHDATMFDLFCINILSSMFDSQ